MYDEDFLLLKSDAEKVPINFDTPSPQSLHPLCYNVLNVENEVHFAIQQVTMKTAPGFNQILNVMLQKLHLNSIAHFISLLNRIFNSAIFPPRLEIGNSYIHPHASEKREPPVIVPSYLPPSRTQQNPG